MFQFTQHPPCWSGRLLPKVAVLGIVLMSASACAVVGPPPPPRVYAEPRYTTYYDYPPYYGYWIGPTFYFSGQYMDGHRVGKHHSRRHHR